MVKLTDDIGKELFNHIVFKEKALYALITKFAIEIAYMARLRHPISERKKWLN